MRPSRTGMWIIHQGPSPVTVTSTQSSETLVSRRFRDRRTTWQGRHGVSRPMSFSCTRFWRSSSIPTGATAVFRCGRGGRPSYWSPAGRENRSSPAGTVDASSGGCWARNDCSTDGCCSASAAAAHSAGLSTARSRVGCSAAQSRPHMRQRNLSRDGGQNATSPCLKS